MAWDDLNALAEHANRAIGKTICEINRNNRTQRNKGAIGTIIEESWFGQTPHNDSAPDFPLLGVELKVTPYFWKRVKGFNVVRAKERLVCNIIDYCKEVEATNFESSSFYRKCNTMLMMFYEHIFGIEKNDFRINNAKIVTFDVYKANKNGVLFLLPEADLKIFEQDWKVITDKIKLVTHIIFQKATPTTSVHAQKVLQIRMLDINPFPTS